MFVGGGLACLISLQLAANAGPANEVTNVATPAKQNKGATKRRNWALDCREYLVNGELPDLVSVGLEVDKMLGPLNGQVEITKLRYRGDLPFTKSVNRGFERIIDIGIKDHPSRKAIVAALGHEIGHSSFASNFHFWFKDQHYTLRSIIEKINDEIKSLTANPAYLAATKAEEAPFLTTFLEMNAMQEKIENLTRPYNELYADLVAVLFSGDARALTVGNYPENRDFTTAHGFRDWPATPDDDQWNYTAMNPVRGTLWRLYIHNLKPDQIELFLHTYIRATELHVAERLLTEVPVDVVHFQYDFPFELFDGNSAPVSTGPEPTGPASRTGRINQEFIRIFVREARAAGLEIP